LIKKDAVINGKSRVELFICPAVINIILHNIYSICRKNGVVNYCLSKIHVCREMRLKMKLIAFGNIFMKDDGIAIAVVEFLKDKLEKLGIEIIFGETDYESCFSLLNANDFIVILDALYMENDPGSIHVFNFKTLKPCESDMGIINFMKQNNKSYKGYIIGIEAAEIDYGNELSPVLSEEFYDICLNIENKIKIILTEESHFA
jgi:hydrogenase maturation protease